MKRCATLLSLAIILVLAPSSMAQDLPKPTPAGEKAVQDLVDRCVAEGGLRRIEDAKKPLATLEPGDEAKLKAAIEGARASLNREAFDVLIVRCKAAVGNDGLALIALLKAAGEVVDDKRAGAFATYFGGLTKKDVEELAASMEEAAGRFRSCGEREWEASSYNQIASFMLGQSKFDRALEALHKALEVRRESLGDRSLAVASSYSNIGIVSSGMGHHAQAREMFFKSLEIRLPLQGERHVAIAMVYHGIAVCSADLGELTKALEFHQKALEIRLAQLGDRHFEVAECYNGLGKVYWSMGDMSKALEAHQKALEIRRAVFGERHAKVAESYNNMAVIEGNLGEDVKALELHQKALEIRRATLGERHPDFAGSLNNIAVIHRDRGEFARALDLYLQAFEIRRTVLGERHPYVAASYQNIAGIYRDQGEYEKALEADFKALEICRAVLGDRHPDVASSYHGIAATYDHLAEDDRALDYYFKALEIRQSVLGEKNPAVADTLANIAAIHHRRGDEDLAMQAHLKALEIRRATLGEKHRAIADSLVGIANIYDKQEEYDKALETHLKALEIYRAALGEKSSILGISFNNLALVYHALGDDLRALEMHTKALEVRRAALGGRHRDVAQSYNGIAYIQEFLGEPAKALEAYARCFAALGLPPGFEGGVLSKDFPSLATNASIPDSLMSRGHLRERDFDPASLGLALVDYRAAAEVLDQLREVASRDEDKLTRAEKVSDIFPQAVGASARLAAASGDPTHLQEAVSFAERGAARVFLEGMGRSRASAGGRVDPATLADEARLAALIREVDGRIAREQDKPDEKRDRETVERLLLERKRADEALQALVARMEREFPQYAALKHPRPCSIAEARAALAEDEVALTYVLGSEASYLVVLSPREDSATGGIAVHKLPGSGPIAEAVAALTRPRVLEDPEASREHGGSAYQMLLAPAASAIAGKRLVIVPGGVLGQLPFELLTEPVAEGKGRFLVQGHSIRYAPSLTALHLIRRWEGERPEAGKALWALGDPVYATNDTRMARAEAPSLDSIRLASNLRGEGRGVAFERLEGTGREVDRLAGLMGSVTGERLMGVDATEAAVKRLSGDGTLAKYRYIHFACHGVLGTGEGVKPGLVLAQVGNPEGQDGYLRLDEVTDLRLNADLVTLSACQTGQGRVFRAEGVSGLARAFLYAGSRGVLCSLWQVDDEATGELMSDLYANLKAGRAAADSLRSAQLKMIEAGEPPLHWAPFVLIGR